MAIIQEYLTTEISLPQMVKKYHIGWTTIPKWMRKFGIPMPNEAPVQIPMSEETKKPEKKDTVEALESRLQELQAELDREKLKNLALNTMIEVAEEELQIDIRKKPLGQTVNRLRELTPEQSLEQLCALFGKTRHTIRNLITTIKNTQRME